MAFRISRYGKASHHRSSTGGIKFNQSEFIFYFVVSLKLFTNVYYTFVKLSCPRNIFDTTKLEKKTVHHFIHNQNGYFSYQNVSWLIRR